MKPWKPIAGKLTPYITMVTEVVKFSMMSFYKLISLGDINSRTVY